MSAHVFLNDRLRDDRFQWVRDNLPDGKDGFTHNDLDSVPRIYTPSNPDGMFMLVEWKWNTAQLKPSQIRTFKMIDGLLRIADPDRMKYHGFYVVTWRGIPIGQNDFRIDPTATGVMINGFYTLPYDELRKFLLFQRRDILPHTFR